MKRIKGKDILYVVFPFIPLFTSFKRVSKEVKEDMKGFDFWDSLLGWSLKLYTLTIVVPILAIFLHVFGCLLKPEMMRYDLFEGIWESISGFYVTGTFLDVAAWRWQLGLLLLSFLFTWMTSLDE